MYDENEKLLPFERLVMDERAMRAEIHNLRNANKDLRDELGRQLAAAADRATQNSRTLLETALAGATLEARMMRLEDEVDWTRGPDGRSNTSQAFEEMSLAVEKILRSSAHDLIGGNAGSVAGLIMAQLAHVHGFVPRAQPQDVALGSALRWLDVHRSMFRWNLVSREPFLAARIERTGDEATGTDVRADSICELILAVARATGWEG